MTRTKNKRNYLNWLKVKVLGSISVSQFDPVPSNSQLVFLIQLNTERFGKDGSSAAVFFSTYYLLLLHPFSPFFPFLHFPEITRASSCWTLDDFYFLNSLSLSSLLFCLCSYDFAGLILLSSAAHIVKSMSLFVMIAPLVSQSSLCPGQQRPEGWASAPKTLKHYSTRHLHLSIFPGFLSP